LLRGISSGSDDVDEDDERKAELDLVSEDELDYIVTISTVCELELPSGASETTGAFEHPASS